MLRLLFTSALGGGEGVSFTPRLLDLEKTPTSTGTTVDPRVGLDVLEERKMSYTCRDSNQN